MADIKDKEQKKQKHVKKVLHFFYVEKSNGTLGLKSRLEIAENIEIKK
jgi:hypothetical protein